MYVAVSTLWYVGSWLMYTLSCTLVEAIFKICEFSLDLMLVMEKMSWLEKEIEACSLARRLSPYHVVATLYMNGAVIMKPAHPFIRCEELSQVRWSSAIEEVHRKGRNCTLSPAIFEVLRTGRKLRRACGERSLLA